MLLSYVNPMKRRRSGTNLMIPNNNLSVIRGRNKPRIGYDSKKSDILVVGD